MLVTIVGHGLPGRRCGPNLDGEMYENVHVGVRHGTTATELQPGDADQVTWTFEVRVRAGDDGRPDFGGPYVYGKRGDRCIGLSWGDVDGEGAFDLFRRPSCAWTMSTPRSCRPQRCPGSGWSADSG